MKKRRDVCISKEQEGMEERNQPQGKTPGQAGSSEEILVFLKVQHLIEEVYIYSLFYLGLSTTLPIGGQVSYPHLMHKNTEA